jgi:hypothetical protein
LSPRRFVMPTVWGSCFSDWWTTSLTFMEGRFTGTI